MKLFRKAASARRRINSLRHPQWRIGPKSRGLSGETHSIVCRRCKAKAESLRQKDGDAVIPQRQSVCGWDAVLVKGLLFVWSGKKKEGNVLCTENPWIQLAL